MLKLKLFVVGMLATLSLTGAWAQTGSIQGTVKDNSGAVIQGADVIVRNIETNAHRSVSTSATGVYSVPNLSVGHYEITAKKDSFKAFHLDKIELTVAQTLGIEITLEPGMVSEEVMVRASDVPAVDLESAQVSNIVDSKRITSLPLATRDPYELVLLSPGTIQSDSDLGGFSVNGARERNNNFLLDGADNNDTSVPGIAGGLAALNPDATEEFRVITNNFMPEYGRNNGAIIDVVTKSGGNDWHGGARWFGRYNALGARDYFNHNLDPNTGNIEAQNPYVRNQFGFNFGGPIIKNKTFFFVDADWQRFRTTLTNHSSVPNAAFKSMLNGGTFNYTDYDANDCAPAAAPCILPINAGGANSWMGTGISPTIKQILSLYPDPNGPAVDQFRGTLFFPSSSRFDARNLTAKIDQHIGDKHLLSVHGAYDWSQDPNGSHDDFLPGGIGASGFEAHTLVGGASLTSTLTSRLVNQAKFAYNKADIPFNCGGLSTLNVGATDQYGRPRDFSLPDVAGFGCLGLFDSNGQWRKTGTWSWGDSVSWVRGAHTVKLGGDARFVYEDGFNSFTSRSLVTLAPFSNFGYSTIEANPSNPLLGPCDPFGYFGGPTNSSDPFQNCGTDASGNPDFVFQDMANTLIGVMDTEQQSQFFDKSGNRTANDLRRFRQHEYDFYVQDSWKIRSNLTLNFGVRYQFNGVPYEVNNNLSNLFENPSAPAPDALNPLTTPGCDPTLPTCSGFTFTNVGPGTGHLLFDNNFNNFEPRLGLAWDPFRDGKTAVRAAFGIFHDRVFGNLFGNATGNPPFQQTPFFEPFDQPENVPLPTTVPTSFYTVDGAGFFPTIMAKHFPLPYTSSWNFGIQRELRRDLVLDLNYVGNRGFHEFRVVDGNPPQPALVAANLASGTPPDALTFNSLWFGGPGVTSVYNSAFLSAALNQASGNSWYDGLQANLTKRFSKGFQFQAAYTYSHAIDDANDPLVAGEKTNRSFPRDSFELFNERGNSGFDIRHRLVLNYAWDLPVGKSRAYLSAGFLGRVLEGWQLAGITTIQSGHPFDLFGNRDSEHTGLSARLDLIGDPSLPAGHPKNETGVNLAGFDLAPYGQAGNVSRNRFFGPGYNNWDMVMSKDTSIGERMHLQFRTEVFNVFNRTQFDQPGNLLRDPGTFGFSTQTISRADGTTSARQMQFGLKLQF